MKEDIEEYIGFYVAVVVPNRFENLVNFVHYGYLKRVNDRVLMLDGNNGPVIIALEQVREFKIANQN